jgi:hypothetical protein
LRRGRSGIRDALSVIFLLGLPFWVADCAFVGGCRVSSGPFNVSPLAKGFCSGRLSFPVFFSFIDRARARGTGVLAILTVRKVYNIQIGLRFGAKSTVRHFGGGIGELVGGSMLWSSALP